MSIRDWASDHKLEALALFGIGLFVLGTLGLFAYFNYGGTPLTFHASDTETASMSQARIISCEYTADGQRYINDSHALTDINSQLNKIGDTLSAYEPTGTTTDVLALAEKSGNSSEVQMVSNLNVQYLQYHAEIQALQQKYSCD